jgi:pSer/pThr/pTyr-binding forkhead associated (FHA) protein
MIDPVGNASGRVGERVQGHLEVWTTAGRELLPLVADRCTIGRTPSSDLVVDDRSVSAVHALIENLGGTWFVEDLGSRNGTFVGGQRISGRRSIRPGEEFRLGAARLVLRGVVFAGRPQTEIIDEPPRLTQRERDVLVALCQPLLSGDPFTEPASIREIATTLVVSDAAVKQHLAHLFIKFGIDDGERRRVRLANAALTSGAVTLGDLRNEQ